MSMLAIDAAGAVNEAAEKSFWVAFTGPTATISSGPEMCVICTKPHTDTQTEVQSWLQRVVPKLLGMVVSPSTVLHCQALKTFVCGVSGYRGAMVTSNSVRYELAASASFTAAAVATHETMLVVSMLSPHTTALATKHACNIDAELHRL